MRQPDEEYDIPLWEVNHSRNRLIDEEIMDFMSYKLGYEMKEQVEDPSSKAYKHFSDEKYPYGNVSSEYNYNPNLETWLCADFNRKIQCMCLMQVQKGKYVFFDEVVTLDATTTEQAKNLVDRCVSWGIKKLILSGDNTSNQRAGNYGRVGKNDWEYVKEVLKERGVLFDDSHLKLQNPKRKVRVDKVNNIIYSGKDRNGVPIRRMIVHERCEYLIKDYRFSVIGDKGADKGLKIDNGNIGHISDASDYGMWANEGGDNGIMFVFR